MSKEISIADIEDGTGRAEYLVVDEEEWLNRMRYDPPPLSGVVEKAIRDGIIMRKPKVVN